MKEISYEKALARAASLCSVGEHCCSDIREKLLRWGLEEDDVQRVIQYLKDENYIDNERYARAFCHDKLLYNHWGRQKMQLMLRAAGLSSSEIRHGIEALSPDEYHSILLQTLRQKMNTLHEQDAYARRAKLIRHLLSRGFLMDEILEVLS